MRQKGLVSISFRGLTPETIIRKTYDAGLDCIEWGSDVHAPCNDLKRIREIVQSQGYYGITCSSYGTYFRIGTDPADGIKPYILAARALGTDILRIWLGSADWKQYTGDEQKYLLAQCMQLAEIAKKEEVRLCLECHPNTCTQEREDALLIMREIASPFFRMYWQPNQFRTVESNLRYAEEILEYTEVIHVFNWKGHDRYPLLAGADIWRRYLAAASQTAPLLLEFMPDDRWESLAQEAESLRKILEGRA